MRERGRSNRNKNRRTAEQYYSVEETRARLESEAHNSATRWANEAARRCGGDKDRAQDLLQDTFLRIIDGSRRWPRDVNWEPYFYMTLKSVSSNLAKKECNVILISNDAGGEEPTSDILGELELREFGARYANLFRKDPPLHRYACLRLARSNKSEIKVELDLTERAYRSLHRKFMRHLLAAKNDMDGCND